MIGLQQKTCQWAQGGTHHSEANKSQQTNCIQLLVAELKPAVKQFTHFPCTKEGALYKDDELMRATRQPVRLKKDFKRPADKVEK